MLISSIGGGIHAADIRLCYQMTVHRFPPIIGQLLYMTLTVCGLLHTPDGRAPSSAQRLAISCVKSVHLDTPSLLADFERGFECGDENAVF
jgi:hypothetical protein